MVFTGTYEQSIDAKRRLAIPSEIRDQVQEEAERRRPSGPVYLYVTIGEGRTLCLYTEERFEHRAAELDNSPLDAEQLLAYERVMFSLARRVELDKQGRVLLPENLVGMAGLAGEKNEVVLIGVKDHLEVRDRKVWQAYLDQLIAERPEMLMNPRRAMKPQAPPQNNEPF